MSAQNVTSMQPKTVVYRDHNIVLTHRPKINDWQYHIEHTHTITLSASAPRYQTALADAERTVDTLMGDKP